MSSTGINPVFCLAVVLALCMLLQTAVVFAEEPGRSDSKEIFLYGLFPTSGPLTSQGDAGLTAFELAVSDINTYLTSIGSGIRVIPQVEEMDSESESTLDKLTKLHDNKAVGVLTYISSSQADAVRDYCKSNGLLLIATGSSSPSLAVSDDNLIRLNPDDTVQARVTAGLLAKRGITHVLPLVRNDIWGQGLIKALTESLPDGVKMEDGVFYNPNTTDYGDDVSTLDQKTANLLKSAKPEEIAIYIASFSEIQAIMTGAAGIRYGNLSKVSWVGCDKNALLPELTGGSVPAEYAYARNFTAITFGSDLKNRQNPEYRALQTSLGGSDPDGYTQTMYDAAWILVKALLMDGVQDTKSLQDAVVTMAEQQNGLSGDIRLNKYGDRYTGTYQIWGLERGDDGINWKMNASAEVRDENPALSTIAITPLS